LRPVTAAEHVPDIARTDEPGSAGHKQATGRRCL
jgi:hypothetical protein